MWGHVRREVPKGVPSNVLEGVPIVKEDIIRGGPRRFPVLAEDRSRSPVAILTLDKHPVPLAHLPSFWHHLLFGTLLLFNLGVKISHSHNMQESESK